MIKTIAIDANEANEENRVGVNMYAYEIIRRIYILQDKWQNRVKFIIYLKNKPLDDMPDEMPGKWEYRILPGSGLWILSKLMPRLIFNKDRVNLLFTPSHYTPPLAFVPRIVSIMDLGYLKFSGQFEKKVFWQLKYWSAISIIVSKRIIAISRATAKDIVRHYPFASKKIIVTQLGYDRDKFHPQVSQNDVRRIKEKYHIVDDYVLYISTLKPSKNVEGLIAAFAKVNFEFPSLKLVVAGKKGWMYDQVFAKVQSLGLKNKVIFTDYLPEADKPLLIKGAKAVVMPSFWEGFGLVPLEAMAMGVPAIVSNTGSLPEIAGDAAIMVDPHNTDSIAVAITKILKMNQKRYNKLSRACINQANKFSWDDAAEKTLELLLESVS